MFLNEISNYGNIHSPSVRDITIFPEVPLMSVSSFPNF